MSHLSMSIRSILLLAMALTGSLTAAETILPLPPSQIDLLKVFQGAPVIYLALLMLSVASCALWLYSLLTLRLSEMMPSDFINQVREQLAEQRYESVLASCQQDDNFCSSIIACGISARKHGPQVMMDVMQAEGRRSGNSLWQRISFLSEIAVIAPMLGLLGTVIGLFFAFYDVSRTPESIASLFDGLGIAVGTTVAGLIVAIIAMIFYTTLKFRVVNLLNAVENEVLGLVNMIEVPKTETKGTNQ